ncbi:MAG: hypothetical protein ACE5FG_11070 [Myxococcota bacterium]
MSEPDRFVQTVLQGCGANVGPLIGTDLESGPVSVESVSTPPEGDLAVLPIVCKSDDETVGTLYVASPLVEIATLARRLLNDEEPDKQRELSDEDRGAVGEVLSVMSGAVAQALQEQVNEALQCEALPWWSTQEPGDNRFEDGELELARGSLSVPGGQAVQLFLVFQRSLLEQSREEGAEERPRQILLLGLGEELENSLRPILESAQMQVQAVQPDAENIEESYADADVIIIAGEDEDSFARCRTLRLGNASWTVPTLLCRKEPTQSSVVRAIESGASYVLRVPADETTLLAALERLTPES